MAGFEHGLVEDTTRPPHEGDLYATRESVARMIERASLVSVKILDGPAFDPEANVNGEMHGQAYDGPLADVTAQYCTMGHLTRDWPKGAVAYLTGISAPQG